MNSLIADKSSAPLQQHGPHDLYDAQASVLVAVRTRRSHGSHHDSNVGGQSGDNPLCVVSPAQYTHAMLLRLTEEGSLTGTWNTPGDQLSAS